MTDGGIFVWLVIYLLTCCIFYNAVKEFTRGMEGFLFKKIEIEIWPDKPAKPKAESEFFRLLAEYWKAAHDKLCPIVEFE